MDLLLLPSMFSPLLLCSSLALIFLFIVFFFFTKTQYKSASISANLPPGRTGWPVMGETLEFLLLGRKGQPQKFLQDRMERHSPDIFRTSLFGDSKMTFFCGPSAHKFLFSNENKLVASWWPRTFVKILLSEASVTSDPHDESASMQVEESRRFRALISGFLKLDALQNYIPVMDSVARQHIDEEWGPKREKVVVAEMAKMYTFDLACHLLLRVDDPKQAAKFDDRFSNVIAGLMSVPVDFPGTTFNRAIKDANLVRNELLALIKQRKIELQQKNRDSSTAVRDLISHLLVTPDENGKFMNEMEIAGRVVGVLLAGYDTASTTITFVLKYLAELPHFYEEVFKEQMEIKNSKGAGELLNWVDIQKMRYSWNVTCEAMRLAPPAAIAFKEALTDFSFAGFTVPKGWKTCWSVHSTHKNPAFFPNPEKFDPTRFEGEGPAPYTFVPFGGGPRMCPGKEYARLEILVFMHNLVTKFKWSKLIPNEKIVFKPIPVPESGLPIRLQPHQN